MITRKIHFLTVYHHFVWFVTSCYSVRTIIICVYVWTMSGMGKCWEVNGGGWVNYVMWADTGTSHDAGDRATVSTRFYITPSKGSKFLVTSLSLLLLVFLSQEFCKLSKTYSLGFYPCIMNIFRKDMFPLYTKGLGSVIWNFISFFYKKARLAGK